MVKELGWGKSGRDANERLWVGCCALRVQGSPDRVRIAELGLQSQEKKEKKEKRKKKKSRAVLRTRSARVASVGVKCVQCRAV